MIFFIAIPLGLLAWAFAIAKAAGLPMSWWFCLSPIWVPLGLLAGKLFLDWLLDRV